MQVLTKYFGALECADDSLIEFPYGLPAFENEHQFALIENKAPSGILLLQSTSTIELCFLAIPVTHLRPEYELKLSEEDCKVIACEFETADRAMLLICGLITLREGANPTANLAAPLVINRERRLALQVIRMDPLYSHQHPIC
jgi:flagellar assembly factor FliW